MRKIRINEGQITLHRKKTLTEFDFAMANDDDSIVDPLSEAGEHLVEHAEGKENDPELGELGPRKRKERSGW